jgi:hypothetical protein
MKRRKLIFSIVTLTLIAGTAIILAAVPQKLGQPGVKARQVPGDVRWQIDLPEVVMGCSSTNREMDEGSRKMLPPDTSFAERVYFQPKRPAIISSVILMGTDRTSIHKAEYCLQGSGMHIVQMTQDVVRMYEPQPYDLPVIKIVASQMVKTEDGKMAELRCVYVYWYVTDGALSNDSTGFGRMWSMAKQLVCTGVLQRWAYVRFFSVCEPGQEDDTYDRIKEMMTEAVPQFQTTPKPLDAAAVAAGP